MSEGQTAAAIGLFVVLAFVFVGMLNGYDIAQCQVQGNTAETCLRIFNP